MSRTTIEPRAAVAARVSLKKPGARIARRKTLWGLFFLSPWLIGLFGLVLYPMALSLYYSFTNYDIVGKLRFVGLSNYKELSNDPLFWQSLYNTLYLIVFMVPVSLAAALGYALLLNLPVRGQRLFRTVFYLPHLVPPVAGAMLWVWIFNPEFGLINSLLGLLHITGPLWLNSMTWSKPSVILMQLWGIGGAMVIFLAGLQGVPATLLEAALLDGANAWQRLRHVTIPSISPLILFNLVMGILGAMQFFTQAYIMGGGSQGGTNGVGGSLEFAAIYLFQLAFQELRIGYASAMSWVLFAVLAVLVGAVFLWSRKWTHYEGWRWK